MANLITSRQKNEQPLARLRNEFEQLVDRFFGRRSGGLETESDWSDFGDFDLEDRPDEFVVRAEVPGFETDELDVQVSGRLLTIKADKKPQRRTRKTREGNGNEWRYRSFFTSVTLPEGTEADRIEAKYRNGLLEVHIPKNEEAKSKRIAVKS